MSQKVHLNFFQNLYLKDTVVIAICQWLPFSIGKSIRAWIYRYLFSGLGAAVKIESGAEFEGTQGIHLGNHACIGRDVRIQCHGKDSRIHLDQRVRLDRGVDIKTHRSGTIEIGSHAYIGPYTCLSGDFIKIGKDCLIASHSSIYANNHIFSDSTCPIRTQGNSYRGIVIEDDCWLGSGVRVVDGVTIGKGSVIGAGAVVTRDIPPYSVAVGIPARVVSQRKQNRRMQSIHSALENVSV